MFGLILLGIVLKEVRFSQSGSERISLIMSKKQQSAVEYNLVLHVEPTKLVDVVRRDGVQGRDVQTTMWWIVDGEEHPEFHSMLNAHQTVAQHSAVLAQLTLMAKAVPDVSQTNLTIESNDPWLADNLNNQLFGSPVRSTNNFRPGVLDTIRAIGVIGDQFKSFLVEKLPTAMTTNFTGSDLGFKVPAAWAQAKAQPVVTAPKVDRRFSSGEASSAKPTAKGKGAATIAAMSAAVEAEQADLFAPDDEAEQQKAA
jgi:hypothetical protein